MSLVGMRKYMHNKMRIVMLVLTFFMGVGIVAYFGLGSYNNNGGQRAQGESTTGNMATVGGDSLSRQDFLNSYQVNSMQWAQQNGMQVRDENTTEIEQQKGPIESGDARGQTFQQCIDQIIVVQAAKSVGIKVDGGEVDREINAQVDRSIKSMFAAVTQGKPTSDSTAWQMLLPRLVAMGKVKTGTTMDMYKEDLQNEYTAKRNLFEQEIYAQKLQDKLKSSVDMSDKAVRASFDSVTFRRLTIDPKRPDAQKTATELADKLKKGADFAAAAKLNSDDPMKSIGGLVSGMPMSYLQPEVSKEIRKMQPGEVAGPFKMENGLVILKLEKRESQLPADFNQPDKQKTYRANYLQNAVSAVENEFITNYKKSVKVEVLDPEMKAYQALSEARTRDAATLLKVVGAFKAAAGQIGQNDSQGMSRCYSQVAAFCAQLSDPSISPKKEDQVKYKAEEKDALLKALQNIEHPVLRLMLAQLYIGDKKFDDAQKSLEYVSDNSYNNPQAHKELLTMYKQMEAAGYDKAPSLVAAEVKWQADYDKQQKEQAAQMQAAQAAQAASQKAAQKTAVSGSNSAKSQPITVPKSKP